MINLDPSAQTFPPFSLTRLLTTVFQPFAEKVAILIDLPNPADAKDFAFLSDPALSIQRKGYEVFYQGLKGPEGQALGVKEVGFFAYQVTGGSNLDLPATGVTETGAVVDLVEALYRQYPLILCISTYSATAPLTAFAHQYGFRGATLHGLNDIILASGLSVNYFDVSKTAEKLRRAMTKADAFELDYEVFGETHTLRLLVGQQEAQKSHGLCHGETPDVANLPAGEVYYVPTGAEGRFPLRYENGTIGLMHVVGGRIQQATLLRGDAAVVAEHNAKLVSDPVTGEIGELGFGTQILPVSGRDIQDEKILGTIHVATGRSDHLGGALTPDKFTDASHATHDDILFAPFKTPEIHVAEVRMERDGQTTVVYQNYRPAAYLENALLAS